MRNAAFPALLLLVSPPAVLAAGDDMPVLQDPVVEYQRRARLAPSCSAGDAMGFDADVALPAEGAQRIVNGGLRMGRYAGRLGGKCLSGSKTYWRATVDAPADFALLKRYLMGKLTEV